MIIKFIFVVFSLMAIPCFWMSASANDKAVLVLATNHVSKAKLELFSQLAGEKNIKVDYEFLRDLDEGADIATLVLPYDLVIFDSMSGREAAEEYAHLESLVREDGRRLYVPIKITTETPLRKGIDAEQATTLYDYYYNGGEENLRRLATYLSNQVFSTAQEQVLPPIVFPAVGIYHPRYEGLVFNTIQEYKEWIGARDGNFSIGIALSRETIASGETHINDELIAGVERIGGLAVPFYYSGYRSGEYIELLKEDGHVAVDNIINTRVMHWAENRRSEYEQLGVPVLQVLPYTRGDQEKWEGDQAGIPAQATPFYLTKPEIAGAIDPIVISARDRQTAPKTIDYQLNSVINKAVNLAKLKHMDNADKRVAIMFYNYPPGEKNAGASFLNIPTSLASIFRALKDDGYTLEKKEERWFIERADLMLRPFYRDMKYEQLPGLGEADGAAGLLPVSAYRLWYETLPEPTRLEIENRWGQPEESFSVVEFDGQLQFIIPRSISGNVVVLPQPPRGNDSDVERSIYHNMTVPISHHYLAVYYYVREKFGVDAIVHLGTHGSQEWLPGKERGLSLFDHGNLAVGDVPVVYPFIMDNVGEALQTKRRGRATVISHLTPPFAKSGLYAELLDLQSLIHQYREMDEGGVKTQTKQSLIDAVVERNIHADLGWDESEINLQFDRFISELHDYLSALNSENQPLGMHTFGMVPDEEHLVSTLVQMMGDRLGPAAERWLQDYSPQAVASGSGESATPVNTKSINEIYDYREIKHSAEFQVVRHFITGDGDIDAIADSELQSLMREVDAHYQNFHGIEEHSAFLEALSGRYVSSGTGGDPIRSPEALPSGKNLYGFDPGKVPSPEAWEVGKTLMADLIDNYFNQHGEFPDKLSFSMWSIETMRHHGVVEAQVMYAMGVRPVWSEGGRVTGTEIIPYSELKRPRIDVVISATGLYRDAFPNVMMLLSQAVESVAQIKEDNNFVYRHTQRIKQELLAEGVDEAQADTLSTIRVFSNESGNYGTNLASATLASDTWDGDAKLANLYLSRMGFFYGNDETLWSQKLADIDLFAKNLTGTDVTVFSRSSNLYGMLTSDDPFQYMGGISLAVRHLDGASPEMYISNLRDPDNNRSEPMGRFLASELRTRQFHPQWIEAMQAEGYAGTLTMLDVLNNFWGWQVVDPDNVRDDQWQDFFEIYVQDKYDMNMREWFEEHNAHALAQKIERMLEAARKEYWDASEETIKELVKTYQELAQQFDVVSKNKAFNEYMEPYTAGFGLAAPLVSAESAANDVAEAEPANTAAVQQVTGQKMEQVAQQEVSKDYSAYYWLLLVGLFFVAGVIYQLAPWQQRKNDTPDDPDQGSGVTRSHVPVDGVAACISPMHTAEPNGRMINMRVKKFTMALRLGSRKQGTG